MATDSEVRESLGEWRDLADKYLEYEQDNVTQAKRDTKRKTPRKTPDPHADRKANLLQIYTLRKQPPESIRSELAAWKKMGKNVVANVEIDKPGWCHEGRSGINRVRQLLGLKEIKTYRINSRLEDINPEIFSGSPLTIALYDKDGKIVAKSLVTNIQEI